MRRRECVAAIAALFALARVPASAAGPGASVPETLRISGTGSGTGGMALLAQAFARAQPGAKLEVAPALGSSGGIRALQEGRLSVAVSNRPANAEELARSPLADQLYARTPFVIAVHREVGIDAITTAQLAALYQGTATTFPNGRRARPMLRRSDLTDSLLMKRLGAAMPAAIEQALKRPGLLDATTDSDAADVLESTPGALGPCTLALIESEKRPLVALALDGKAPTLASLASGDYPHNKPLYLLHRTDASIMVQRFVAFVRSEQGRRILSGAGHLPL